MSLKESIRDLLRTRGIELAGYRGTVTARRQQLLEHYDVDLVVDIGANVGQYAQALRRAGYRRNILSFEPLPQAYMTLEHAAASDALWDHQRVAVGAAPGTLTLHISERNIFSSALPISEEALRADPGARYVSAEEVPVERLDSLMESVSTEAVAVKIDVQGFERDVLNGGGETLKRARLVEVELSPTPIYDGQMLMTETIQRLADVGLTLSLMENLFPDHVSGRALQFNGIFART